MLTGVALIGDVAHNLFVGLGFRENKCSHYRGTDRLTGFYRYENKLIVALLYHILFLAYQSKY